jgi:RNA 3'-terminal phosphate cyclase (ATP)
MRLALPMLTIDGSQGEGGGQVLRSSLTLSLVTGTPFRIERVRAGRQKPGLQRQHLTAVRAAAQVGNADVRGAELHSTELTFVPGAVTPGDYHFAIGTAGSATLVLQTVLPALLRAAGPSHLTLEGGTHNPHAPPFDFLAETFTPVVTRMGPKIETRLVRPGFYPVGGGEFQVTIAPGDRWQTIDLLERGKLLRRRARAVVARLPRSIAERELRVIETELGWGSSELVVEETTEARGPGNVVLIELESEQVTEVLAGFGSRGVPAEAVARDAVEQARRYLRSPAPVGEHLADQLLIPFALAGGGAFRAVGLARHATTNINVIRSFLPLEVEATQSAPDDWLVRVRL